MKAFIKGTLDTLRIAFIITTILFGIFVFLAVTAPQPPTSSGIEQ